MLPKRKAHADHNYEVCTHLLERGGSDDWVVTTAFYACLHYALAYIFPFTDQSEGPRSATSTGRTTASDAVSNGANTGRRASWSNVSSP